MSNVSLSLDTLLMVGRVLSLVMALAVFSWGFVRWRRAAERDTQRVFEQLDLVRADLLIMKEVMQSAAQRVDTAAKQVAHDVRLAPTQNSGTGRGYEIAARLARNGAQKEELIKSCGITTHEAELLVRLHGHAAAQKAAAQKAVQVAAPIQAAPKAQPKPAPVPAQQTAADRISDIGRTVRQPQKAPQVRSRLVAVG
jgi:hypothetical protein